MARTRAGGCGENYAKGCERRLRLNSAGREACATSSTNREEDGDNSEVGQHRGAAVAQERGHYAGEREHAQRSGGDEENLQGGGGGQAGGEEEFVVRAGAQSDAQSTVNDERIEREYGSDAEKSPLFAESGENEIGMRGGDDLRVAQADSHARRSRQ